jgi:hypothetical protein
MTDLEFVERHHPFNTQHEDNGGNVSIRLPTVDDGEPFLEFAAIYKAVRVARERFVMVKLGGGYAAHSVDAQQTLQDLNPMPCQLVIVETEPTHFEWAKRHLAANGIDPLDPWLIKAAASTDSDPRLFMLGALGLQ